MIGSAGTATTSQLDCSPSSPTSADLHPRTARPAARTTLRPLPCLRRPPLPFSCFATHPPLTLLTDPAPNCCAAPPLAPLLLLGPTTAPEQQKPQASGGAAQPTSHRHPPRGPPRTRGTPRGTPEIDDGSTKFGAR